ncbi:histidine--tRNA ligase [Mycoplasmopsis arginini]|uniref:histidine--tRNA ligase n=1 Tax=Mycoplasmopsis arginini TaxID=2094 RepID=UPI00227C5DC6|nr:histidine--tRNA ligase [Mycoplasmopsis arginini]MCY2902860.1 histidine--tRNA ligase [Mycoplasmopsis arginini QMP CG1-2758]MDI3349112.1 histidine--tRNA ligase [Mycoplasmopsis arginini]MDI3350278.1 histidine--tRNA ligase [Mycoplasmopsis arginini]MDI3350913.1 histidine--tRNA ligase [Mycoplasmopsis arginini]MDI3351364.1 histidine--tRNA ligase [Mycoplasmopsis arginini]
MFNRLKGTKDIFGKEARILNFIRQTFEKVSNRYNFSFIETPIIEDYALFVRATGETSDIVTKEMYVFQDKGQRTISLRPECTASTIRAYVENKINNLEKTKLYYFGPMFRYERPQKGRYRQFIQGGVELIEDKSVLSNFEIIKFANDFLTELKLNDFVLQINNLGSFESRNKYINYLKEYFQKYKDQLSEISQLRLEKNVLRILDDKEENQKEFVKNAPKLIEFLSDEEKKDFDELINLLNNFGISYEINPYLVRGLDYYTDIVFEFVSTSEALGSQSTILGGGRYDGMIESFGGPKIGSIGFAFGLDRIAEIISFNIEKYDNLKNKLDILIAYLNDEEKQEIINIAYDLRKEFNVELINKKITIKQLFKQNYQLKPNILIFKELNSKENEIKMKINEKEFVFEYRNVEDFKNKLKEVK